MILLLFLTLVWLSVPAARSEEAWTFPDDDLEARIAEVSEGELSLLETPPDRPVHHHRNRIRITRQSLEHGWVMLEQCHEHLDPVAETQIVYHPERIRNIQLSSIRNIEAARVEGPAVQLEGIGAQAAICLRAESRALSAFPDHHYRLKNGPYMRRFLDGYYPMRVTLEVHYPATALELVSLRPHPGKAGSLEREPGRIRWDGWFKGRLFTVFDFATPQRP